MEATESLADTLIALVLNHVGRSLEVLMAKHSKTIGIFHHEGLSYCYEMKWEEHDGEIDFFAEVFLVTPNKRKDRKPKVELAASRQFTHKV